MVVRIYILLHNELDFNAREEGASCSRSLGSILRRQLLKVWKGFEFDLVDTGCHGEGVGVIAGGGARPAGYAAVIVGEGGADHGGRCEWGGTRRKLEERAADVAGWEADRCVENVTGDGVAGHCRLDFCVVRAKGRERRDDGRQLWREREVFINCG